MKKPKVDDLVPAPPVQETRLSKSERSALGLNRSKPGPGYAKTMISKPTAADKAFRKERGASQAGQAVRDHLGIKNEAAKRIVNGVLEMEYPGMGRVQPPEALAQGRISADELDLGRAIEMEHTNDPTEAEAIAIDHLSEDPEYYTKLHRAGIGQDTSPAKSYMVGSPMATGTMTGTTSGG